MMQFCYVVTSGPEDHYADMAYLSASATRRLHPGAVIRVLLDRHTEAWLRQSRSKLLDLADKVLCVDTELRGAAASRFVKTQQRALLEGSFVFLDVDTLPVRPLDTLFVEESSFAASINENPFHPSGPLGSFEQEGLEIFRTMGWSASLSAYYNSGVMYWADTSEAHLLGLEWHRRWSEMYRKTGVYRDQPALNSAIPVTGVSAKTLDAAYNLMLEWSTHAVSGSSLRDFLQPGVLSRKRQLLQKAHVWHFGTGTKHLKEGSLLDHLITHYHRTGEIDWQALDTAVAKGVPWADLGENIQRHLLAGQYRSAAKIWLRRRLALKRSPAQNVE